MKHSKETISFNREETLERAKELLLLSSGFIATPQVEDYFGITAKELNKVVRIHKDELMENGYVDNVGNGYFTPRAIKLLGMLLGNNVIATEIRTQLINIEGHASSKDKIKDLATERDLVNKVIEAITSEDAEELERANTNLENHIGSKRSLDTPQVAKISIVK